MSIHNLLPLPVNFLLNSLALKDVKTPLVKTPLVKTSRIKTSFIKKHTLKTHTPNIATLALLGLGVMSTSVNANLQDSSQRTLIAVEDTVDVGVVGKASFSSYQPSQSNNDNSSSQDSNISNNVNNSDKATPDQTKTSNVSQTNIAQSTEEVIEEVEDNELPKLSSLENTEKLVLTLPDIQHFNTANGVPVSFVASTSIPIVDVDIRFNAGSARDGEIRTDGFGIANMVAIMLTQGTQSLTEEQYNHMLEQLGTNLSVAAYKDMFVVSFRSLSDSKQLVPATDLLSQVLTEPTFSSDTLARNKSRLLVGLQQQQQNPSAIASIRFNQALYGNHPYAHPTKGTLTSVPTLTQSDLQKFQQQFLVANNASIAITGNLTLAQAKQLANQITRNLISGNKAQPLPDPKPLPESKYVHIPFDSTQTTVIMGHLGKKRSADPQQWQAQTEFNIANHILAGGDFNARLMKEIRKKRGLTYGIYGSMTPMQSNGSYKISFSTRNDKLDEGIRETLKTVNKSRLEGLTAKEISLTKNQLSNGFPMSFASNSGINNLLGMMNFYQLPDHYLADHLQRIEQAKPENINQSLKDNINPDNFLIVTVGAEYSAEKVKSGKVR